MQQPAIPVGLKPSSAFMGGIHLTQPSPSFHSHSDPHQLLQTQVWGTASDPTIPNGSLGAAGPQSKEQGQYNSPWSFCSARVHALPLSRALKHRRTIVMTSEGGVGVCVASLTPSSGRRHSPTRSEMEYVTRIFFRLCLHFLLFCSQPACGLRIRGGSSSWWRKRRSRGSCSY